MVVLEHHGVAVDPDRGTDRGSVEQRAAQPVADDAPMPPQLRELLVEEAHVGTAVHVAASPVGDDAEAFAGPCRPHLGVTVLVPVEADGQRHVALDLTHLPRVRRVVAADVLPLPPVEGETMTPDGSPP